MKRIRAGWRPTCEPPQGLVRPVRLDPSGVAGPTPGTAYGSTWRRTSHGFHVPATVSDEVPEQRILEQSMRLPPQGAVTGWAACRLLGAAYFDGLDRDGVTRMPVPLWVGRHRQVQQDAGARVIRDVGPSPQDVVVRSGVPCTRPARAAFDAARLAPDLREAVVALDMMAAAELTSLRQVAELTAGAARVNGRPQVRSALRLASEDSWSPSETRLRLLWVLDARRPPPRVNVPIFDTAGRLLGIADLLDAPAGVVGEYDGADHRSAGRQSRDLDREARLRDAGLELCRFTAVDLHDPRRAVARIHAAFERATRLRHRAWTLRTPGDWQVELPLHERLEMRRRISEEMDRSWQGREM